MAFDAGAIVGKLVLDKQDFDRAVKSVGESTTSLGSSINSLGKTIYFTSRQIGQVGRNLAFLGSGIMAPLILTFKSAEKYSNGVRYEMERLTNATIQMRVSVAESLVPIMHRLSNILADLTNRWMSLSPQLRENILQITFISGAMLALGGTFVYLISKIGMLVGGLLRLGGSFLVFAGANLPFTLIAAAIGGVIYLMLRYQSIGTPILNTMEILALKVARGYEKLVWAMAKILEFQARMAFNFNMADYFKGQADAVVNIIDGLQNKIDGINETGQGKMAETVDGLRNAVGQIKDAFSGLGTVEFNIPDKIYEASKSFSEGFHDALNDTLHDLTNWGQMAANVVQQTTQGMQTMFSNLFQKFLKGQIRDAADVFVEFGNFVLKVISDVIAQIITAKIIAGIGSIFSAGAGTANVAGMGSVKVAPANYYLGHAEGIENVPYTGLYKLHADEEVRPSYMKTGGQPMQLTIVNQITTGFVNAAIAEEPGTVINVINEDTLRSRSTRKTFKITR